MAAELEFITSHFDTIRVILIGISQGAAFSNAVLQSSNKLGSVSSIELGMPFLYFNSRRIVSERTLAIDGSGLMPDSVMEWDIKIMIKAFCGAVLRWSKYQLLRKPRKFTFCINKPGHEYNWEYPEVQRQIVNFLNVSYGTKGNQEVKEQ